MQGKAADIVVQEVSSREVAKYAESIGILGIGLYETSADGYFTHIDTRTTKSFWYGKNEQPRTTFGGTPAAAPSAPTTKPNTQSVYHKSNSKYNIKLLYLQKGDRGRDVQILQELLKIHGYNVETSGEFDTLTYNAVVDFQKKTKIDADGIVGSQTMEKLLTV
jgi:murein L,D-transpeptidase YcbB/YkuD